MALYHFGRSHTNGDVVVLFPADRVLAAGDMYTKGDDVPELIDYSGGGSAVEWPSTLRSALQLDFDTVVPGHGPMATKQDMAALPRKHDEAGGSRSRNESCEEIERRHREDAAGRSSTGRICIWRAALNGVIEEAQ